LCHFTPGLWQNSRSRSGCGRADQSGITDTRRKSPRLPAEDGAPIAGQNPDIGKTYCSVLMQNVHSPGEPLLKVMPDRFEIKQLREYNDFRSLPRIYVSSAGSIFSGWPINVIYSVEMRLDSPGQPGVRALICAKRSGLNRSWNVRTYYPNLAEIRSALGDIIEIIEP
jgi:hypothetical protein